jgi:hypothetical protein
LPADHSKGHVVFSYENEQWQYQRLAVLALGQRACDDQIGSALLQREVAVKKDLAKWVNYKTTGSLVEEKQAPRAT